jgi:uncharacterized protein (TIGR03067 family)
MKRALKLPFVVLVIVGLFAAGGAEAKDNRVDKQELKRLQGTWVLVSGEVDGKKVASKAIKASRMTYSGDTMTLTTPHQSKRPITGRLKRLDPKKAPREMDWVRSAGPGAGRTMQAIYEFEGKDTLQGLLRSGRQGPSQGVCHHDRRLPDPARLEAGEQVGSPQDDLTTARSASSPRRT